MYGVEPYRVVFVAGGKNAEYTALSRGERIHHTDVEEGRWFSMEGEAALYLVCAEWAQLECAEQ